MNMQRYSLGLYAGLAEEEDYPMNYHVTGSIRLAHDKIRMLEFERARTMGRYQGLGIEMMFRVRYERCLSLLGNA